MRSYWLLALGDSTGWGGGWGRRRLQSPLRAFVGRFGGKVVDSVSPTEAARGLV